MRNENRSILIMLMAILFGYQANLSAQSICEKNWRLVDSNGEQFTCEQFRGKTLLIFNSPPQCHDCEEKVYQFLSQLCVSSKQLFVIFGPYGNTFVRQQLQESAHRFLNGNYTDLYYTFSSESRNAPIIYFLSDGKIIEELTLPQIFSKELYDNSIRKNIKKKIRRFLN